MARILVTSLPFAGHVGPMAAVAQEMTRRGHEVVVYSGAKYRQRFACAGATWLPWNRATDFDDADLAATFPRVGDGKGLRGAKANGEYVLFGTGAGQAADILAEARREPFDLLVADQLAFGAALAGEVLGTPWASVAVTPLSMTSEDLPPPGFRLLPATGRLGRVRDAALRRIARAMYKRLADPLLNDMRAAVGLGPAPVSGIDSLYSPHLVLAQGVPGLEYPRADLPAHVHFVGRLAVSATPDATVRLPPWWPELADARARGRPVVHVTQGTLDVDPEDLLKPAIAGLAGQEPLVVCTTGGGPPSVLGPLPGNVRAAPLLPHDELLPLVDVMVTNGGWGGVLAAVQAGVPLVVAGRSLDKPEVARRVAWSGAGLDLRTGRPGPGKVHRAVTRVLSGAHLRERARELGAALTAAGGVRTAGTLVDRLLSSRLPLGDRLTQTTGMPGRTEGHVGGNGRSPRILEMSWGHMDVEGLGVGKDFKLYPGGGRAWDWAETGMRHRPGIQPGDVEELLTHGATTVVLSRGMDLQLHVDPATVEFLKDRAVAAYILETRAAVRLYNDLAGHTPVAGLFHSTC